MRFTPLETDAVDVNQACLLAMVGEPRNIRKIVWLSALTLAIVVLQSVYLFVWVGQPISKLERTVARHTTQIDAIFGTISLTEVTQNRIMEKLNGSSPK
jgi:hypothetical protein